MEELNLMSDVFTGLNIVWITLVAMFTVGQMWADDYSEYQWKKVQK